MANELFFSKDFACRSCGISYPEPEPRLFSFNSPLGWCPECEGLGCQSCSGSRLRPEALAYRVQGWSIAELSSLDLSALKGVVDQWVFQGRQERIAGRLVAEVQGRLSFLLSVGVGYLTLLRPVQSLSGGEAQRIRLATQIGSGLVDVVYVLDEPSIGLHPRDHDRLMSSLEQLRDLGNTVLVVEHDRETMERADFLVDLGPGAGTHGGQVVASGHPNDFSAAHREALRGVTADFLSGRRDIVTPASRRSSKHSVRLGHVTINNLKNLSVEVPLGVMVGVSGVSGSGKSSLIMETLVPVVQRKLGLVSEVPPPEGVTVDGVDAIDKLIEIDQSPIGRTPRSNPATYTGVFSLIRDLFSSLPEAQIRGFKPGRFSFNVAGGRCESCEGDGQKRIEMHFLPDVYVPCDECQGLRYSVETLEVRYKGFSISDILNMPISDAYKVFEAIPAIYTKMRLLEEVGLGYLSLGQSATTLSGGEAQRIKLARELSRRQTGKTLYVLDEPSTGLHFDDLEKLISLLQALTSSGNTVVVIEHNLDLLKCVDYLIDMGPEGGASGGQIVAQGTPEEVASSPQSHTGRFLRSYLSRRGQ